ncbi:hypothetical protein VTO73DRAFT_10408 [Trametes versicolor]
MNEVRERVGGGNGNASSTSSSEDRSGVCTSVVELAPAQTRAKTPGARPREERPVRILTGNIHLPDRGGEASVAECEHTSTRRTGRGGRGECLRLRSGGDGFFLRGKRVRGRRARPTVSYGGVDDGDLHGGAAPRAAVPYRGRHLRAHSLDLDFPTPQPDWRRRVRAESALNLRGLRGARAHSVCVSPPGRRWATLKLCSFDRHASFVCRAAEQEQPVPALLSGQRHDPELLSSGFVAGSHAKALSISHSHRNLQSSSARVDVQRVNSVREHLSNADMPPGVLGALYSSRTLPPITTSKIIHEIRKRSRRAVDAAAKTRARTRRLRGACGVTATMHVGPYDPFVNAVYCLKLLLWTSRTSALYEICPYDKKSLSHFLLYP